MEGMRHAAVTLLVLVGGWMLPDQAWPQSPAPTIVAGVSVLFFDHDGIGVQRFEAEIDGSGTWAPVAPTRSGTSSAMWMPFPAMTPGAHVIRVRACYVADASVCLASDPFAFVSVVAVAPKNLRIGAAPGGTE